MRIPILDLSSEIQEHWNEFNEAFQTALRSAQFIMGPSVKAFESEIASYLGVKHAIGCNSGTDALVIGLRALGVGPGDEVLTTPFTFFATAEAVSLLGASPVFVDIDPVTFNLDPKLLEQRITPKTKAIIPVHLYGHPVEMEPVLNLAKKHNLKVLEDVAQAMGGEYRGTKLGTLGHLGAFSFFPSKNLGGFGDGGLMATNDDGVADICRMLRTHGSRKKYYNETVGYNSRLDEVQAAMLRVKLKYLDRANEGRRQAARRYAEVFQGMKGVTAPTEQPHSKHVFHQYTIRILGGKRDAVKAALDQKGIGTMLYYPVPIHQLDMYRTSYRALPATETAATEVLSLPIWPTISPEIQLEVTEAIRLALG